MTPAVGALADVRSLRQCDGGFSVFFRPDLALRLAQLADDGQLLLPTATGQLLVWILECLACCRRPSSRQRGGLAISGCCADSWGRLKGRWPLEWSQELHCSYSAHGCQTALRAGGFALDYGGSAVAAAGGAWLHVQYCRSKLLLVRRQRGGGQQLRFKLDGRPQPQPKPLACDEHVPGVAVRRCGGVQRACVDLNYAATDFARAPRLTVLAGLASGGVGAGGTGHEPLTQKQAVRGRRCSCWWRSSGCAATARGWRRCQSGWRRRRRQRRQRILPRRVFLNCGRKMRSCCA